VLARRELQEIVVLTSRLATQLVNILTSKNDHLFSSFGIRMPKAMSIGEADLKQQDAALSICLIFKFK